MRRFLTVALAGLLGFAAPAFAQNATPVLISQGSSQVGGSGTGGQDALAQVPDGQGGLFGPGGPSPILIAGGLGLGVAGLILVIVSQNRNNNPVSP